MFLACMVLMTFKMLKSFNNKMMVLILMEGLFLMSIMNQIFMKSSLSPALTLIYLTMFMVLDSTMGISIMISSSRNSATSMKQFKKI